MAAVFPVSGGGLVISTSAGRRASDAREQAKLEQQLASMRVQQQYVGQRGYDGEQETGLHDGMDDSRFTSSTAASGAGYEADYVRRGHPSSLGSSSTSSEPPPSSRSGTPNSSSNRRGSATSGASAYPSGFSPHRGVSDSGSGSGSGRRNSSTGGSGPPSDIISPSSAAGSFSTNAANPGPSGGRRGSQETMMIGSLTRSASFSLRNAAISGISPTAGVVVGASDHGQSSYDGVDGNINEAQYHHHQRPPTGLRGGAMSADGGGDHYSSSSSTGVAAGGGGMGGMGGMGGSQDGLSHSHDHYGSGGSIGGAGSGELLMISANHHHSSGSHHMSSNSGGSSYSHSHHSAADANGGGGGGSPIVGVGGVMGAANEGYDGGDEGGYASSASSDGAAIGLAMDRGSSGGGAASPQILSHQQQQLSPSSSSSSQQPTASSSGIVGVIGGSAVGAQGQVPGVAGGVPMMMGPKGITWADEHGYALYEVYYSDKLHYSMGAMFDEGTHPGLCSNAPCCAIM